MSSLGQLLHLATFHQLYYLLLKMSLSLCLTYFHPPPVHHQPTHQFRVETSNIYVRLKIDPGRVRMTHFWMSRVMIVKLPVMCWASGPCPSLYWGLFMSHHLVCVLRNHTGQESFMMQPLPGWRRVHTINKDSRSSATPWLRLRLSWVRGWVLSGGMNHLLPASQPQHRPVGDSSWATQLYRVHWLYRPTPLQMRMINLNWTVTSILLSSAPGQVLSQFSRSKYEA